MEYTIIIAYILGTFTGVVVYRQGLKDKRRLKDNRDLQPLVKSPIKAIKEAKQDKEVDELAKGMSNLLAYDGTEQK